MNTAISIGNSGLHAAQLRLDAAGHNIAVRSVMSDAPRQQVVAANRAEGGVNAELRRPPQAEPAPAAQPAPRSAGVQPGDVVEQHHAAHLYTANLAVVRTADRMLGGLLDTTA